MENATVTYKLTFVSHLNVAVQGQQDCSNETYAQEPRLTVKLVTVSC